MDYKLFSHKSFDLLQESSTEFGDLERRHERDNA